MKNEFESRLKESLEKLSTIYTDYNKKNVENLLKEVEKLGENSEECKKLHEEYSKLYYELVEKSRKEMRLWAG